MLNPTSRHIRPATWAVVGLEAGAVLFMAGLALLYLNPFWHFDDRNFLDWRAPWWNSTGEVFIAAGLLTEALALVGSAALIVSRCFSRRSWMPTLSGTQPTVSTPSVCKHGTKALAFGARQETRSGNRWLKYRFSRCCEDISG